MNKWVRKAILGIALILSLGSLAACGKKTEDLTIDPTQKASLEQSGQQYAQSIYGLSAEDLDSSITSAEKEKNAVVYNGLTNYKGDIERLGKLQSVDSVVASKTKEGYELVIDSTFEQRKMKMTLGLSDDMQSITELSFEPVYTLKEEMTDAGGNFIVGMVTVFAVLIFISFIIYLFKYVNVFANNLEKKKNTGNAAPRKAAPVQKAAAVMTVPAAAAVPAALSGDELQAVIAAAIAAYESENGSDFAKGPTLNNGLVVRSIKRHY